MRRQQIGKTKVNPARSRKVLQPEISGKKTKALTKNIIRSIRPSALNRARVANSKNPQLRSKCNENLPFKMDQVKSELLKAIDLGFQHRSKAIRHNGARFISKHYLRDNSEEMPERLEYIYLFSDWPIIEVQIDEYRRIDLTIRSRRKKTLDRELFKFHNRTLITSESVVTSLVELFELTIQRLGVIESENVQNVFDRLMSEWATCCEE